METPTKPARDHGSTSRGEPAVVPSERPRSGPRRLIELSHQIDHGMVTYPGLPGPEISDHLPREAPPARYGPGTEFHIGRNLCGLDQLPASGFRFRAAPPQVVGIGTFPIRAYAVLADG